VKYFPAFCGALGATILLVQTTAAKPVDYISSALAKTRVEKFQEAIAILKTGEQYYQKQGDSRRAYASKLLVLHIQQDLKYRERQRSGAQQPDNAVSGTLLGSCLGEDCQNAVELFAPANTSPKYGGILVLQKRLRYFQDARNLPQPIWGIVDVKVLPARKPGEEIDANCQFKKQSATTSGRTIVAFSVYQKKAEGSYDAIPKRAWTINPQAGLIDEIPVSSIACTVEMP
jgi:hypothetical protein